MGHSLGAAPTPGCGARAALRSPGSPPGALSASWPRSATQQERRYFPKGHQGSTPGWLLRQPGRSAKARRATQAARPVRPGRRAGRRKLSGTWAGGRREVGRTCTGGRRPPPSGRRPWPRRCQQMRCSGRRPWAPAERRTKRRQRSRGRGVGTAVLRHNISILGRSGLSGGRTSGGRRITGLRILGSSARSGGRSRCRGGCTPWHPTAAATVTDGQ